MARRWTEREEIIFRSQLEKLYVKENRTISDIGKILGIAESSVYDRIVRLNIPSLRDKKPGFNNTQQNIRIPRDSDLLAEFTGILLGDGHITPTQVTVTLGNKEKKYVHYVAHVMYELFEIKPTIIQTKDGYYIVYIGSVVLVRWLLKMGLAHNKVKSQVDLPSWILKRESYKRSALKGLFDTDGSVYKLRFGAQINFTNRSLPLLKSVRALLIDLGFKPSVAKDYHVYLTRRPDLVKFNELIGFGNPKHEKRYEMYVEPLIKMRR